MSKIQQAKQCRFRDTVLFEHSRYSILNYVKKLWLTNLCTWSAARHYNTAVMNCVHLRLCICRPLKNLQAHNSRHNNVQCSGAVSLCCPYSVWSWLWTITFMLPKSTEPKIRLDWTRRASVDGYTSACCDLDFLTLWRQKLIIISMSPLTSVTNIWWNFLHRFLRHGIHKVFGTYRLTPLRPNSQTNRPEYSMPPAPFFNGGGVIINTKMKFRKVSSVILTCAVVRDGCLIGNISTSWTPSIFNACGALLVLDSGTKLFKLIAGATLTSLRLYRGHRHSYAKSDMSSECFLTNLPSFIRRTAPWQRPRDGHFSHAFAGIWNIVRDVWRNNNASGLCTFIDCGCRNLSVTSPNGRRYWICERVNAFAFVRSTYTSDLNFWRTTTSKLELDMRRVHPRLGLGRIESQNWHACMGRVHCSKRLLEFTIRRPTNFWTYQPVVWVHESIPPSSLSCYTYGLPQSRYKTMSIGRCASLQNSTTVYQRKVK